MATLGILFIKIKICQSKIDLVYRKLFDQNNLKLIRLPCSYVCGYLKILSGSLERPKFSNIVSSLDCFGYFEIALRELGEAQLSLEV